MHAANCFFFRWAVQYECPSISTLLVCPFPYAVLLHHGSRLFSLKLILLFLLVETAMELHFLNPLPEILDIFMIFLIMEVFFKVHKDKLII